MVEERPKGKPKVSQDRIIQQIGSGFDCVARFIPQAEANGSWAKRSGNVIAIRHLCRIRHWGFYHPHPTPRSNLQSNNILVNTNRNDSVIEQFIESARCVFRCLQTCAVAFCFQKPTQQNERSPKQLPWISSAAQ